MDIEKLDLSVRTYNAFKRAGVNTVEDYINNPDKDKLKDVIGSKAVNEFLAASMQNMKYDATSMTQYHGSIAAGIKRMCGRNKTAMDLVNDGSPAPLRDYLKKTYKYNGGGDADLFYGGNPSKGVTVKFDNKSVILSWSQVAKFIRDNPSEIFDDYDNAPLSAPVVQPEAVATFDYSKLDSDTAAKLESITAEIYSVRKEYIFTMAKKIAYAHDLLANCGNGKFGAWCESVGISRYTGNNLVRIVELFGNSTAEEQINLNKLTDKNVKLLYEAAKPSAPAELVDAVKNGDITTHKEYIALKKELESQKQMYSKVHDENQELRRDRVNALNRADNAERELSDAKAEIEKLSREADEADREYDAMADRECHYETEICELKHQIKELESRPRDVAVQSDPEDAKRIAELEEEIKNLRSKPNELDFGDDDGVSADKLSEFYEMLHGKVLAALKDCKAFVLSDDLPQIVKDRAVGRFGTLKDLITMYIEDMEE